MKAKHRSFRSWLAPILLLLILTAAGVSVVVGQIGGGYNLEWNVGSSSGSMSSTAMPPHALSGSAGQAAAGGAMTGGNYSLSSGFWQDFLPMKVFLPSLRK